MITRGRLKFLAASSPPPVFGPSVGGANAQSSLSGDYETREVEILDGRALPETVSLDIHGFELRTLAAVGDLYDPETVARRHDAQCAELVASVTGAARTHTFDHTWRSDSDETRGRHGSRAPSAFVHSDYTPRSAAKRVEDILGEDGQQLARDGFAIVNVWRPIVPVRSSPLAVCDARSLAEESLLPAERRGKDRIGEIFLVRFDPEQRWIYFPDMTTDEVLLVKTFDTRCDGRSRWCAHTSFDPPHNEAAPSRESIETRLFAFFQEA